ncbi:Mitochondrial dicarboxylate transporter [Hypsizygus marmoreus]|uniref:Mitochondrial dicarboxylate transporter n=1 Tax=Hypsizygus marmoreus TaxID=39966 RepID=A0A369K811_HYPMA|nr:Mitochondrial dicarboxylate transporter [Hypsizygus marmoreus]
MKKAELSSGMQTEPWGNFQFTHFFELYSFECLRKETNRFVVGLAFFFKLPKHLLKSTDQYAQYISLLAWRLVQWTSYAVEANETPFHVVNRSGSLHGGELHPSSRLDQSVSLFDSLIRIHDTLPAPHSRMQTLEGGSRRPSTLSVIRVSIAQSGFRSLYAGLTASLMRQMSYSLVRLGTYEELKARLSRDGPPSTIRLLLAASLAGGLGGVAGNPADILLVRMTSDSVRPPDKRYGYSNAVSGLISLVKDEGIRGLARGLGPNTARAVLMNASQVGSYDLFKSTLLRNPIPVVDYQLRDNLLLHVIASLLAGTFATTVCSPADVLRSRVMAASCDRGVAHILATSLREEGPRFLFKGWTPAFIRLGPNTVLLFVFYEQLKKGWKTFTT